MMNRRYSIDFQINTAQNRVECRLLIDGVPSAAKMENLYALQYFYGGPEHGVYCMYQEVLNIAIDHATSDWPHWMKPVANPRAQPPKDQVQRIMDAMGEIV